MNITSKNSGFRFMKIIRYGIILAATALVAACGGSSSGSFDNGGSASLSISVESNEVPTNSSIQVTARFRAADGSAVADGTQVTLSSSNTNRGVVAADESGASSGASATTTTSGGQASFIFTARSKTGTVTLTASGDNPSGSGTISSTRDVDVVEDPDSEGRLEIDGDGSMPANTEGVEIFMGSPFINELTVRYRNPDGSAGNVVESEVAVAVSPVSLGAFSTLDDPETEDVNEFLELFGSGPVTMTAGVATVFVHSDNQPGTLTVSVSAQDADSGDTFSEDFQIEIVEGAADFLPANLDFSVPTDPLYIEGSGGSTSKSMSLVVSDSGDNPVPNPEGSGAEFNNVILSLDAPDGSDARLTGTGADGSVSGSEISVQSVNGVVNFSLSSGSEIGPHRITATVDRADNNVDNDLLDPLSETTTVRVGDGQLFAVHLVQPTLNAIRVNGVTDGVESSVDPNVDPETGASVPPDPDGTYSVTVTAIGTDRAGNPPLPGQSVSLGKIDSPVSNSLPWLFTFSGSEGDPEEGGVLFTVDDVGEGFLDDSAGPDEAVEPGDTLALMGDMVAGNREHEAVRFVSDVVDDRTLNVTQAFNPNNATGGIVDDGAVIPWVIGRSELGSIDAELSLNERGVGSVKFTYPINTLGQPVVLWAQGERVESDQIKTVADVAPSVFPGVAPAVLTAQPGTIVGNQATAVTLCLTDALRAPINSATIQGAVTEGTAAVSLDGSPMPASSANQTGTNGSGCVNVELDIDGMVPEGDASVITFSHGEAQAEVQVLSPGAARLLVDPTRALDLAPGSSLREVTLTLLNADGEPIQGIDILGECDGGDGTVEFTEAPGVTDDSGQTTATVLFDMAACGEDEFDESFPRIGQCEFTTSSGSPIGLFTVEGRNLRSLRTFVSPSNPDGVCPPLEDDGDNQLVVDVNGGVPSRVLSDPEGIDCGLYDEEGDTVEALDCISNFAGSSVLLQAPTGTSPTWSGDCAPVSGTSRFANVDFDAAGSPAVCIVDF
ncbi:hypothetical protein [Wenzhouxiangella sp. EGI_FJ10305]|uniref:hypothetical protein n=1 Tax=Wenzhouxiangella sp. EGI_FJ10305 TaxID=3243768 RepID=UPI0035D6F562